MFGVPVQVDITGSTGQVAMDSGVQAVQVPDRPPGAHLHFEQPGPVQREYQVDGSDTTSRDDRDRDLFRAIQTAPWYRLLGWLRDESSYSRWQDVQLIDPSDGHVVASGISAAEDSPLPSSFRVLATLHRPEAPARIWLQSADGSNLAGLSVERDLHRATWQVGDGDTHPTTWFFPNDPWPFAAELLQLTGRSAAAALALLGLMAALAWAATKLSRIRSRRHPLEASDHYSDNPLVPRAGPVAETDPDVSRELRSGSASADNALIPPAWAVAAGILTLWLTASLWVATRLYHQLPHIVDAQAYYFQARIFESGHTWLQIPALVSLLDGFQQVEWNGRWFGQYPPGAPALYALGGIVGLAWLVGPLSTLALLVGTTVAGKALFDVRVALTALVLLAISPFVLFQSGSFMSHPIAGGALACSLAAFALALRTNRVAAWLAVGGLLGLAFTTREVTAILYAVPYTVWLLAHRRLKGLALIAAAGLPFVAIYLLFNLSTTGDPLTLPRNLFNARDRWGFGDLGTFGQHTLAAGLVNTDENLTLLQFDLFGWPPLAALALMGMPFLLGRAGRFDLLLAAIAGGFVVVYVGYFYHGIALGPRYYFEAVPAFALLAARGLQCCVQTLRSLGLTRPASLAGAATGLAVLCAWTFVYYLPREIDRRMDYGALSNGKRMVMPFISTTPAGPQLEDVETPALVLVTNGDVFKSLSGMNCPNLDDAHLSDCPVLFLNTNLPDAQPILSNFPGRQLYVIDVHGDLVTLERVPTG